MRYSVTTARAEQPVTLAEAKTHLRIDGSEDDTYITSLIVAATDEAENFMRLSTVNQTITLYRDVWPSDGKEPWWDGVKQGAINEILATAKKTALPMGNVSSVTSVTTYDDSDNGTVWASSNYYVQGGSDSYLVKRDSVSWPNPTRTADGIKIIYVSGYGATAASVPVGIKQSIKMMVAYMFENRGDCQGDVITKSGAYHILQSFRKYEI